MYLRLVGADRYVAKFLVMKGKYVQRGDTFSIPDEDGERLLRERPGVFEKVVLCPSCKQFAKEEDIKDGLCPECYAKKLEEEAEKEEEAKPKPKKAPVRKKEE